MPYVGSLPEGIEGRTEGDGWLTIRLALSPWRLSNDRLIGGDPTIVRRLEAGDGSGALALAVQRLRAAGIVAPVRITPVSGETARLWAAALAFPISARTAARIVRRLAPESIALTRSSRRG